MTDAAWSAPPDRPTLPASCVDVWRVRMNLAADPALALFALSADERDRAARFRFAEDRARFVFSRSALRAILGRYLGKEPASLAFHVGAFGKPSLVGYSLAFNASASGSVALVAVSDLDLGVDVEHERDDVDPLELAATAFSPDEREALARAPLADRRRAFFAGFTRKEAVIKAKGLGLAMPLADFSVSLDSAHAALLRIDGDDADLWTMHAFSAGEHYPCALAYRAPRRDVRFFSMLLSGA